MSTGPPLPAPPAANRKILGPEAGCSEATLRQATWLKGPGTLSNRPQVLLLKVQRGPEAVCSHAGPRTP